MLPRFALPFPNTEAIEAICDHQDCGISECLPLGRSHSYEKLTPKFPSARRVCFPPLCRTSLARFALGHGELIAATTGIFLLQAQPCPLKLNTFLYLF